MELLPSDELREKFSTTGNYLVSNLHHHSILATPPHSSPLKCSSTTAAYFLEAGFAGFEKPQKNLNFPQKDCLRTPKLSILQCVFEIKIKRKECCHYTHYPITVLLVIITFVLTFSFQMKHVFEILLIYALFSQNIFSLFTHFFRRG